MAQNPFQLIDRARAEKIAARKHEKSKASLPLFADVLEPLTAEQVQCAAKLQHDRFEECCRTLRTRGEELRRQVQALVGPDAFSAMEARLAVLPDSPEYFCDHWSRMLERVRQ